MLHMKAVSKIYKKHGTIPANADIIPCLLRMLPILLTILFYPAYSIT